MHIQAAAHLCIDMQRLFSPQGPWPAPWLERVLPQVVQLVERAPERTVFTRFLTPHNAEQMAGTWRSYYQKWHEATRSEMDKDLLRLMPALERHVPPAHVHDKFVYSAFADGTLHVFLRQHNINTLIVTGSETDVCVLATVLAAVDLGYRIIVVSDAVCSSSDASHDALIELYARRFSVQINLARTEEVLDAWRP